MVSKVLKALAEYKSDQESKCKLTFVNQYPGQSVPEGIQITYSYSYVARHPNAARNGLGGELRGKVIISSNPHVCFLVSVFATTKLIFPRNGTKREREESREGKLTNDLDDKLTSCVRAENKKVFEEGKTACFLLLFFHERNMLLAALRNCYLRRNQIALDSMEMNET